MTPCPAPGAEGPARRRRRAGRAAGHHSLFQADAEIHRSIARAAHGARLSLVMNAVCADLFLPVDQDLLDSSEDDVFATQEQIVATIRARDAEGPLPRPRPTSSACAPS